MSRLTGWWSGRSSAAKVELYTRWTFHAFAPLEIVALAGLPIGRAADSPLGAGGAAALILVTCVHAVLGAVVASRALDWGLDRREHPTRLVGALVALTAGEVVGALVLLRTGLIHDASMVAGVSVGLVSFALGTLALCVAQVRRILYAVPATAVAVGALGALCGIGLAPAVGLAVGVLLGGYGLAGACGFSGWLVRIVWELERSRELKARLAVAEERLRFGRDLHDVMGRDLSVIALKSELAVQLSRRGRPEAAVDQMTEVQRISRESQRELREVVRGYRAADLRTELEGARGVLAAAGIACAVDAPELDLSATVESALGWVVREATTNVLRHGDAGRCVISLGAVDGAVVLTVENDGADAAAERDGAGVRDGARVSGGTPGSGTPGSGTPGGTGTGSGTGTGTGFGVASGTGSSTGSGLAGLRERLGAVDGALEAGPVAPQSFRVTARVPLPAPRTAHRARSEEETVL
ncbi:histidine kinase [Streptomyces sp. NPDC051909]|uniref:sensor histidine kinase n=1 Tax=Streptomyces sp. NPDC051909 TaxID=3154944 RepID=UPI00344ADBDF